LYSLQIVVDVLLALTGLCVDLVFGHITIDRSSRHIEHRIVAVVTSPNSIVELARVIFVVRVVVRVRVVRCLWIWRRIIVDRGRARRAGTLAGDANTENFDAWKVKRRQLGKCGPSELHPWDLRKIPDDFGLACRAWQYDGNDGGGRVASGGCQPEVRGD
jgi:hypothetical protein